MCRLSSSQDTVSHAHGLTLPTLHPLPPRLWTGSLDWVLPGRAAEPFRGVRQFARRRHWSRRMRFGDDIAAAANRSGPAAPRGHWQDPSPAPCAARRRAPHPAAGPAAARAARRAPPPCYPSPRQQPAPALAARPAGRHTWRQAGVPPAGPAEPRAPFAVAPAAAVFLPYARVAGPAGAGPASSGPQLACGRRNSASGRRCRR